MPHESMFQNKTFDFSATDAPFARCYMQKKGEDIENPMESKVINLHQQAQPPITDADALYHAYADMVYRLAFLRLKSHADAEDILQEVFVRCLRQEGKFRDAEHQKAWLIRVTINCTKTLATSAWRRHTVSESENARDEVLAEMEDHSDVYAAVMELPQDQRTAIHLYYYEGYSVKEIAAIVRSSEFAVKSRLFRARECLHERLKGEYSDV